MTLNLLIAPDFAPERFAGWHMLNTLLQKKSGLELHLLTPASAAEQAQLMAEGKVDAVYANPFDAASMIRELGFSLADPLDVAFDPEPRRPWVFDWDSLHPVEWPV